MKKNLVFLLALAIAGGSVQQAEADDNDFGFLAANVIISMATNITDGVMQVKRLNAYTSTDETEIKKKAKHAMISSTIALIANLFVFPIFLARHYNDKNVKDNLTPFALGCTSLTAFNATTVFRHLFQLYNSFKMYKNAENIAQKNINLTPEQIEQVKKSIALLRHAVMLNQFTGPGNILPVILSCGLLLAGILLAQDEIPIGPHLIFLGSTFPVLSMATDVIEPVAEKMFYKTQYEK